MSPTSESRRAFRLAVAVASAGILAHMALVTSGCNGSDGDGPSGRSTVQGTVSSFSAGGAFYMPREQASPMVAWLTGVMNVFIPEAHAAVAGVTVELEGTGLKGTTDDRGFFIISGAPGGDRVLRFTMNNQSVAYPLRVPDNGVVTLDNVRISDDSVGVGRVSVVETPDDNNNDNVSGNSNSNGNANRNANRNDNSDDNGNDNDDDDSINGNSNGNANANANTNGNSNSNGNDNDDDDDDDDDNGNGNRR